MLLLTFIIYSLIPKCDNYAISKDSKVSELIRQWAPLIWLAPNETFFPSNVEDFLNGTVPILDLNARNNWDTNQTLPIGAGSERFYLVPKTIYDRDTDPAFLYGQDPNKYAVHVHAIVSRCDEKNTSRNGNLTARFRFQVTYWLFYPYNEGKQVCFLGNIPTPMIFDSCLGKRKIMGNHVGDWEHMSLLFMGNDYPDELYLAVHDAGAYYRFAPDKNVFIFDRQERRGLMQRPKFPRTVRFADGHPELFAAKGSHGLWSAPGEHYFVRVPKLYDNNGYGIPWRTWENVEIVHKATTVPRWMKYRGRWGNPKSRCMLSKKLGFCEISDGPYGIPMKRRDFNC